MPAARLSKERVDIGQVQGNILKGFNKPHLRLVFFKFGQDKDATMAWIGRKANSNEMASTLTLKRASQDLKVRRQRDPMYKPHETWIHISLSKSGIYELGLEYPHSKGVYEGRGRNARISTLDPFPNDISSERIPGPKDPFFKGMKYHANILGDEEESESDPKYWDEPYKSSQIDALFIVAADKEDDLDPYTSELIASAAREGVSCIGLEVGRALENEQGKQVEHFGFRDGVSQPQINKVDKQYPKKDLRYRNNNPDRFDPEDFVLFGLKGELEWTNNGSFLVFRKLEQNVSKFWSWMKQQRDDDDQNVIPQPEELAAKIVGRWKSGASLAQHPKYDPVDPIYSDHNDFLYVKNKKKVVDIPNNPRAPSSDPLGEYTPTFAHTRWTNPRDTSRTSEDENLLKTNWKANREENAKHRMLRRGIPYGVPWAADLESTRTERRGLLFICYVRDIWEQFVFVQNKMAFGHNYQTGGPHSDIFNRLKAYKQGMEQWIVTKGGEYFFSPSIYSLKHLRQYSRLRST